MPNFPTYIRYVASGLLITAVFAAVFPNPIIPFIMSSNVNLVSVTAILCPLVGIVYEALSRSHPSGYDAARVYAYVRLVIQDVLDDSITRKASTSLFATELPNSTVEQFYTLLTKSVYETFIWTFKATGSYMTRVDQQIRLAYFYLNIYRAINAFLVMFLASVGVRLAVAYLDDVAWRARASLYLVPWIQNNWLSSTWLYILIFIFCFSVLYPLAEYCRRFSKSLFEIELDSRITTLSGFRDELLKIAREVVTDRHALRIFIEKAKARNPRARRLGQYWKNVPIDVHGEQPAYTNYTKHTAMNDPENKAKVLNSEKILDVGLFSVDKDDVILPNGHRRTNHVVRFHRSVSILAIDDQKRIGLIRQYRYPFDEYLWELPAGMIEEGEKPEEAGRRELQEELGFQARTWIELTTYYPLCSVANPVMTVLLARHLTKALEQPDEGEIISDVRFVPLTECLRMVDTGKIRNAFAIIGILMASRRQDL